jgi:hypothetical protein
MNLSIVLDAELKGSVSSDLIYFPITLEIKRFL